MMYCTAFSVCKIMLLCIFLSTSTCSATSSHNSGIRRTAYANEFEVLNPQQTQTVQQQQQQIMSPRHQLANQNQQQNSWMLLNDTATTMMSIKRNVYRSPSREERDADAMRRRARLQERRKKARLSLAQLSRNAVVLPDSSNEDGSAAAAAAAGGGGGMTPKKGQVQRLTERQLNQVQRKTSWFGNSGSISYNAALGYLADPAGDYDKWAQAYRMLGAFIDCDHDKDEGSQDNNNNNGGGGDGNVESGCARWMMWAAYVNPNYQGYEYDEYFSDEPYSTLDCHNPDTEWELIGVYRQEFYQFIEQISKHLWAIDDYEYIVARAGLMYMTDYDCFQVGQDANGNPIRAAIAPQPNGRFQMALYTDSYCLEPDESVGTYDDYVAQTDVDLGSKDEGDGQADDLYDWWYDSQEYTLENLNNVYKEYAYCTPCMDYPTYQDGYFIGDYGTDDDDLINQCWKFHSHDSFICESECIAMGHSQGSINQIVFGERVFGSKMQSSSYSSSSHNKADVLVESSWSRIMANAFLTFSFLLFIATFLAFAVARRSRYRESRSSKSRRLLDDHDEDLGRSVRSRRSRSRKKNRGTSTSSRRGGSSSRRAAAGAVEEEEEGDGLFRTDETDDDRRTNRSSSRRSKSRSGRSKSGSKKRSSSSARRSKKDSTGDPPSSRKSSSSRALQDDDF